MRISENVLHIVLGKLCEDRYLFIAFLYFLIHVFIHSFSFISFIHLFHFHSFIFIHFILIILGFSDSIIISNRYAALVIL